MFDLARQGGEALNFLIGGIELVSNKIREASGISKHKRIPVIYIDLPEDNAGRVSFEIESGYLNIPNRFIDFHTDMLVGDRLELAKRAEEAIEKIMQDFDCATLDMDNG